MTFEEYQEFTKSTAIYPTEDGLNLIYTTLGLASEAGEVTDKMKKVIRDKKGVINAETKKEMAKEIGDALWYVSQLSAELGLSLNEVAEANIEKLRSRQARGKLQGDGDNR
ncbi:MAG: nucleoside triphosphate pyrophosphohydrolase family protein [Candidatus Harrisonbacteria bacterium]|nr:nucleoside triphosphate pyrophosphohydrolase family protein [Candidatus Harrisonbacteria bacterium]